MRIVRRFLIILEKELGEILVNRMLLVSLASLPLVMVATSLSVVGLGVEADDATVQAVTHWYAPDAHGQAAFAASPGRKPWTRTRLRPWPRRRSAR